MRLQFWHAQYSTLRLILARRWRYASLILVDKIGSAKLTQTRADCKMVENEGIEMQLNDIGVSAHTD